MSTFAGGAWAFSTPGQDITEDFRALGATVNFQKSQHFGRSAHPDHEQASGYRACSGQIMGQWRIESGLRISVWALQAALECTQSALPCLCAL